VIQRLFREAHRWLAWLLVAAIVVQVWLAGTAIPQLGGNGSYETHRTFGYLIGLLTLVLFLAALLGGLGRQRILQSAGLIGLYVVQSTLPYLDPGLAAVAALHPVNAVLMLVLAAWYARAVWRERAAAPA
jgi:hypothetical protein